MNKEIKKQWLEALRSGEYAKGKGVCRREMDYNDSTKDEYCCLGVLGDLYNKAHPKDEVDLEVSYPPLCVYEWAELNTEGYTNKGVTVCQNKNGESIKLSIVNDEKETVTFEPVIKLIEKYL